MKNLKNIAGLVLTEALMAVSIIGVTMLILSSIITGAADNISLSRDYLVAQNLATEGIEAVKGLRDSNWLLKPNDKSCWLRVELTSACTNTAVFNKSYRAVNKNGNWDLQLQKDALDISKAGNFSKYQIYFKDGKYQHDGGDKDATDFYRSVKFLYVDNTTSTFEVKVQWTYGAKVREVLRTVTIYNY